MPIRQCEWDTPGGFTNGGPGDSQIRFPRFLFLSMNYEHIPGSAVLLGEIGGGRERPPPFLLPGSGTAALRKSHLRNAAGGVAPVPLIPGGKAPAKIPEDLLWPSKASRKVSVSATSHRTTPGSSFKIPL